MLESYQLKWRQAVHLYNFPHSLDRFILSSYWTTDQAWALALWEGGLPAPWLKPSYLMVQLEKYEIIRFACTHAVIWKVLVCICTFVNRMADCEVVICSSRSVMWMCPPWAVRRWHRSSVSPEPKWDFSSPGKPLTSHPPSLGNMTVRCGKDRC